jgi:ferritin-like metal-binding protein YciE
MLLNIAKYNSDEAHELRALFEKQLKELYWAEKVMVAKVTGIIADTMSKDLVMALEKHLLETIAHLQRLEQIFSITGIHAEVLEYEAVKCLIKEAEDLIMQTKRGVVRDAGIIAVLQKIEHYEIACYGTMRAYAIALREEEAVTLLEYTLEEEKAADLALSEIAESHINTEAADKEF